jgi:hypothetical protein
MVGRWAAYRVGRYRTDESEIVPEIQPETVVFYGVLV